MANDDNDSPWKTELQNISAISDSMKTPLVSNQNHQQHGDGINRTSSEPPQQEDLVKSLEDIKSSFEAEAESFIIQAIVHSEKERDQSPSAELNKFFEEEGRHIAPNIATVGSADSSPFLAGVPASAVHLFGDSDDLNDSDANENKSTSMPGGRGHETIASQSTDTATPGLNDIAKRIVLMQRMALAKEKTLRRIVVLDQDDNSANNNADDGCYIDPESLVNEDPEAFTDNRTSSDNRRPDVDEENENAKNKDKGKESKCCRCTSWYVLARLIGDSFRDSGKWYLKVYSFLIMPLVAVSTILFYSLDNPIASLGASYSWWLLFAARHAITLILAQITQFILIDYIALETRFAVLFVGRLLTLMAVQAKGWPLIMLLWSLWNFALNCGKSSYKRHWFHMQEWITMLNDNNPSGRVVGHESYRTFLVVLIVVGLLVMTKRILMSFWVGKKNYVTYAGTMESLMRKVLLISEVAMLSQDIALGSHGYTKLPATNNINSWLFGASSKKPSIEVDDDDDDDDDDETDGEGGRDRLESSELYSYRTRQANSSNNTGVEGGGNAYLAPKTIQQRVLKWKKDLQTPKRERSKKYERKQDSLLGASTDRFALDGLLGEWEEPELKKKLSWRDTSIRKILQFRETLQYLDGNYPLSISFGPAETRKQCMLSAQNVYSRLMRDPLNTDTSVLRFDTLMSLATDKDGNIQKDKARALIRLFRPDREGNLRLIDFVKSCDKVYKRIKMLRVNTSNAIQIDEAFEKILNTIFYFILLLLVLFIFGVDPIGMFTAMTGLLLPLSFLFSSASSKYFEGILLILVRNPYDIGDRIAISAPMNETNNDGSTTWFVENITLFTTTVRNAATNEVATYANGSLASLRIINAARSSNAMVTVTLKFGVDVPYEKVKVFRTVVEGFIKARPRKWAKLHGFRATKIEADLGYIQYIIVLQHVESWQNLGVIKESLAAVASFCLEVSKKMDMRFVNPPVSLRVEENNRIEEAESKHRRNSSVDMEMQKMAGMFGE